MTGRPQRVRVATNASRGQRTRKYVALTDYPYQLCPEPRCRGRGWWSPEEEDLSQ